MNLLMVIDIFHNYFRSAISKKNLSILRFSSVYLELSDVYNHEIERFFEKEILKIQLIRS